ncbi:YoaK family protein [Enterococcus sp. CSURQ0835]|uniref:YoaK family protein n=1 Tax=Enterococcus sp. CSURQ0835 TaxID=2681394 RepID=UPI001359A46D|nr:YoaK family protein [Enterococcus sp. CSURQ0835]
MKTGFHESRSVGLLLTFIGGAMDCYTYIKYEAFASAQTGNIVLAIIQAYQKEWTSVGKKLLSTLFFFIGILLAKFLIDYFKRKELHFWRLFVLYYEAVIFFIISFPILNVRHPSIVTLLIAFTAAIQWITFDKINGLAYTNLFTTGNLKGVATNLYDFITKKDPAAKERFFHFLFVVIAFVSGAIASAFFYRFFHAKTILIVAGLFLYLAVTESFLVWRFYQTEHFVVKDKTITDKKS